MRYASISAQPNTFFIMVDKDEEWAFIQPYFLSTSDDHPRKGKILRMECLFSGKVWNGRQRHGFGYSRSADVYDTLIDIIKELHKGKLSQNALDELDAINTHEEEQKLSDDLLSELSELNTKALREKWA